MRVRSLFDLTSEVAVVTGGGRSTAPEIAEAVLLYSPEASFVTGQMLNVDCGGTIW